MNLSENILVLIRGRSLRRTLLRSALIAFGAFIIFRFVLVPVRLIGSSMEPTYGDGTVNLVNVLRYRSREPGRGDIVIIRAAGRGVFLLKRVIGLPGESIYISKGVVYVDGQPLNEPYVKHDAGWDYPEVNLGEEEFFVIGDNRGMPVSGHTFGRTTIDRIVGGPIW